MKLGSKWYGANGDIFEIDDIRDIDGQTWIFYTNTFTMKMFSCLKEAFLIRFKETL